MIDSKIIFEKTDAGLIKSLEKRDFDSFEFYRLNLKARRLLLIQGFQDLISFPTLQNIESYAYQTETALRVLRRYQGRALLCDEVGLGKTIEAGIILKEYVLRGLVKKALILTPPGLIRQWKEEMLFKFDLKFATHEDDDFRRKREKAWAVFPFTIASLNYAKRLPSAGIIQRIHYDIIIVDEAHHLRNQSSRAWQFVNALDKKFLLLLTATPVQNDLQELFNLVTLLKPGQLKTLRDFKRDFVERGDPRKPKNMESLRSLLADCMVRNTRSQIDRSLPLRQAHTLKIRLSPPELSLYKNVTAFLRSFYSISPAAMLESNGLALAKGSQTMALWPMALAKGSQTMALWPRDDLVAQTSVSGGLSISHEPKRKSRVPGLNKMVIQILQKELGSSPSAFVGTAETILARPNLDPEIRSFFYDAVQKASIIQNTAKEVALLLLLKSLGAEKVVVFTHYRRTLENLHATLAAAGVSAGVYHGGLSTGEKDAVVRKFQGELPVLLSTEAGGEGRNLQFCRTLVNFDLAYNPMRIEQRVGRIHRIGQKRPVVIYNLAAEGTLEDYLLKILDEKINMFELVIGEMDMILGQIEEEGNFEDLLLDLWMKAKSEQEMSTGMDLGEKLLQAKEGYLKTKAIDEKIFAQDFETT